MLRLQPRILQIFPHVRQKHLDLLRAPALHSRKNTQRDCFSAVEELDQVERAEFFLHHIVLVQIYFSGLSIDIESLSLLTSFLSFGHCPTGIGNTL